MTSPDAIKSSNVISDPAHVKQIRKRVESAMDSSKQSKLSPFEEEDAPIALDVLLKLLENSSELQRDRLRRLATQILSTHDQLPDSLLLKGVQRLSMDASFSGEYSDIFRGRYQGEDVALKRLRVYLMFSGPPKAQLRQEFYSEALIWKTLSHPHVLPLVGIAEDVFQYTPCIVLPWANEGHIVQHIQALQSRGQLPDDNYAPCVNNWIRQTASGLSYLHNAGVVHGDLRGNNVLINSNGNAQITDFGMSRISETVRETYASMPDGTVRWQAPEIIDPDRFNMSSNRPTYASDIYSFACTCIEIYTLHPPFFGMTDYRVAGRIVEGLRPRKPSLPDDSAMDEDLWTLLTQCWNALPSRRPAAKDVAERMAAILSPPPSPDVDPKSPEFYLRPFNLLRFPGKFWRGIRRCHSE